MRSAHIVVVTGGRDYSLTKEDRRALRGLLKALRVRALIHGDARGADRACGEVADKLGLEVRVRPADWDRHGRAAGAIRNREMLVEALATGKPVALVAFPGGRGTENCRNQAKSMNISIASVRGEEVTWEIHGEQDMTTKKKTKKPIRPAAAAREVIVKLMQIDRVKTNCEAFANGWRWTVDIYFNEGFHAGFLAGFDEDEDDAHIAARLAVKDLKERLREG